MNETNAAKLHYNGNSNTILQAIDNMQANNLQIIAIWAAWFLIGKLIIIFFL